jgi:hypothetical protein
VTQLRQIWSLELILNKLQNSRVIKKSLGKAKQMQEIAQKRAQKSQPSKIARFIKRPRVESQNDKKLL